MSREQFTRLTSQGKDNLFKGSNSKPMIIEAILSEKESKFLQHFQTINNVDPIMNMAIQSKYSDQNQGLYISKLEAMAQSKISQIQRIIRSNEDQGSIKTLKSDYKLSKISPVMFVKSQVKGNIRKINAFFQVQEQKASLKQRRQQQQIFQTQILQIGVYSQIINLLPLKLKQQPNLSPSNLHHIYNTSTQRNYQNINGFQSSGQKNVSSYFNHFTNNTQTQRNANTPSRNQFVNVSMNQPPLQPQINIRKADMLLVEILREKKRKGLVSDYFKIMQIKLFQLLDFILQDQPQFEGLSSIEKMKQVLKKLESFKGKKIEGQNKINLLKIFFQEFRNLKNQLGGSQKKKPVHKVQNKPKQTAPKQATQRQIKQPEKRHNQNMPKRTPTKQTMSVGGYNKDKIRNKVVQEKSVKGLQDQWLGQLQ